jgi:hypothetical protein
MFAALLMVLLTQQPAAADETPAECLCEIGMTRQEQALLKALEQYAPQAKVEEEAGQKAKAGGDAKAQESAADCSEPQECKGQLHHIISRPIAEALDRHKTLRGLYKPRDPRFVSRAVDEKAHCGYQQWHRDVDAEVVEWLRRYERATSKEFEAFLREIYNRPDMRARFPNGF